jgi:hypothetical protein
MKKVKIYCIEDINDIKYIGSTTQNLINRLTHHRFKKRNDEHITSKKLNLYNCIIYELEICDECDRDDRERYWIENTECVNKNKPGGQSEEKLKEKKKIYDDKNKEKKREYDIQYRLKNKERLKRQKEEYRNKSENKEYQKIYHLEYVKKNKEKNKEYQKIYHLEYSKKNKEKKREYDKQRRIIQKEKLKKQI